MKLRHCLLACLLLITTFPAAAQDFPRALELHAAGDFEAAYSMMRDLAKSGHAGAETMLGVMHYHGEGVEADPAIAAAWFIKGAMKGNSNAQLAIGALYLRGEGVARDPEKAWTWLLLATAEGGETATEARRLMAEIDAELSDDARDRATSAAAGFRPSVPR